MSNLYEMSHEPIDADAWTIARLATAGKSVEQVATLHARQSQLANGSDLRVGPTMALIALRESAFWACQEATAIGDGESEKMENLLAHCLLHVLDAARRAGVSHTQLFELAESDLKGSQAADRNSPETADIATIEKEFADYTDATEA